MKAGQNETPENHAFFERAKTSFIAAVQRIKAHPRTTVKDEGEWESVTLTKRQTEPLQDMLLYIDLDKENTYFETIAPLSKQPKYFIRWKKSLLSQ